MFGFWGGFVRYKRCSEFLLGFYSISNRSCGAGESAGG